MLKKFKSLKVLLVIPVFVLLGFFACLLHITPDVHRVADSHTEHGTNQVVCVDHQVSVYISQKDPSCFTQVAVLPQTSIQPVLSSNIDFTYSGWTRPCSPPNKIALYIKNNTFII